ncbi:hypothetical protein [Mucilaginibacter antarcticus]
MKILAINFLALLLFASCVNGQDQPGDHDFAALPAPRRAKN